LIPLCSRFRSPAADFFNRLQVRASQCDRQPHARFKEGSSGADERQLQLPADPKPARPLPANPVRRCGRPQWVDSGRLYWVPSVRFSPLAPRHPFAGLGNGSAGVDFVCSGADFLLTSHRNMERIGMRLLFLRAIWTPLVDKTTDRDENTNKPTLSVIKIIS
jgi:hypothetical protein